MRRECQILPAVLLDLLIGDPLIALDKKHIPAAKALMFASAGCCLAVFLAARVGILYLWSKL